MKYTHKIENGILVISFTSDLLGAGDSLELMDFVNDKINQDLSKAVINMKDVKYMNSSGIGVIITIYTKFKNRNGDAVISNPSDQIVKLLTMTKLDSVVKIYKDEQEAVSKLNG
jgi:anti-sigma B factor antagonist